MDKKRLRLVVFSQKIKTAWSKLLINKNYLVSFILWVLTSIFLIIFVVISAVYTADTSSTDKAVAVFATDMIAGFIFIFGLFLVVATLHIVIVKFIEKKRRSK